MFGINGDGAGRVNLVGVQPRGGVGELHTRQDERLGLFNGGAGGACGKPANVDAGELRGGLIQDGLAPNHGGEGQPGAFHKVTQVFGGTKALGHNVRQHGGLFAAQKLGGSNPELMLNTGGRDAQVYVQRRGGLCGGGNSHIHGQHNVPRLVVQHGITQHPVNVAGGGGGLQHRRCG